MPLHVRRGVSLGLPVETPLEGNRPYNVLGQRLKQQSLSAALYWLGGKRPCLLVKDEATPGHFKSGAPQFGCLIQCRVPRRRLPNGQAYRS